MHTTEIQSLNNNHFPGSNPSISHILSNETSEFLNGQSKNSNQLLQYLSTTIPNNPSVHNHQFSPRSFSPSHNTNLDSIRIRHRYVQADHVELQRRNRRLELNRNSARRSRMRKLKQLEELQAQVHRLEMINSTLNEKVVKLLEYNHKILQANAQLMEENCLYQKLVQDSNQFMNAMICPRIESTENNYYGQSSED